MNNFYLNETPRLLNESTVQQIDQPNYIIRIVLKITMIILGNDVHPFQPKELDEVDEELKQ